MPRVQLAIEYALLGFLYRRPMHGYEIHQQMTGRGGLGLVWHLNQSQLYAQLAKLEEQGYVAATLEPQDARPPRRMLHLTPAGREAFVAWTQTPVAHGRGLRMEFMAKLYSAGLVGPQATATLIARQRDAIREWLAALCAQAAALPGECRYERLVFRYRIGQLESTLAWLAECEEALAVAP